MISLCSMSMEMPACGKFWPKIKYCQSHHAYRNQVSSGLEIPNNAFPNPLKKIRREN